MKKIFLIILCIAIFACQLAAQEFFSCDHQGRQAPNGLITKHKSLIAFGSLVCALGLSVFRTKETKKSICTVCPKLPKIQELKIVEQSADVKNNHKQNKLRQGRPKGQSDCSNPAILTGALEIAEKQEEKDSDEALEFNPFIALGLTKNASEQDVLNNWQKICAQWHNNNSVIKIVTTAKNNCLDNLAKNRSGTASHAEEITTGGRDK